MIPEESWDDINYPSYDAKQAAADKPILRLNYGMTRAERRQFRVEEHRRLINMDEFDLN